MNEFTLRKGKQGDYYGGNVIQPDRNAEALSSRKSIGLSQAKLMKNKYGKSMYKMQKSEFDSAHSAIESRS